MARVDEVEVIEKKATGFFSDGFYRAFRSLFRPLTKTLKWAGVTPNAITLFSMALGMVTGYEFAHGRLWSGLMFGYLMGFSDIIDGQLAKEYGLTTRFGGILDSTIDRYNEFFLFAGIAGYFYTRGEPFWMFVCAVIFVNSVVISYVKARAEADGFDCNVGKFQRPERLTIVAIAVAFDGLLMKPLFTVLAIGTVLTVFQRVLFVKKQADMESA